MLLDTNTLADEFNIPWRPAYTNETLTYIKSLEHGNYAKATRDNNVSLSKLLHHLELVISSYCLDHRISRENKPNYKTILADNFQAVVEYVELHLVDENKDYVVKLDHFYFSRKDMLQIFKEKIYTIEQMSDLSSQIVFRDWNRGVWGNRLKFYLPSRIYFKAIEFLDTLVKDQEKYLLEN